MSGLIGSLAVLRQLLRSNGPIGVCPRALAVVFVLLFGACGRAPEPVEAPKPPAAVAKAAPLPADFAIIIDNSRSITAAELQTVREATMLLADLAELGDRISLVTFGNGARLAALRSIQSDADRQAFKTDVRNLLEFKDQRSDITAGIRVVQTEENRVFRPPGTSIRVPIVLSDGKLEPGTQSPQQAFDELVQDLKADTFKGGVYAIALGNRSALEPIPGLSAPGDPKDGLALMRDHVASSPDRFYHAKNLDQLLGMAVLILSKSKGVGSLGDKTETEYRVDDTVEKMSFIVRKAQLDDHGNIARLCESSDIEIRWPGGGPLTVASHDIPSPGSVLWSNDYTYFDLIVVRWPTPGKWQVALRTGGTPQVSSKVVSPIELRFNARNSYYLNETTAITAWLWDRNTGDVSKGRYTVQAHIVGAGGKLEESTVFVPLSPDAATGQFSLTVPSDLQAALKLEAKPATINAEFIAKELTDDGHEAPWFIRRSTPIAIRLVDGFIKWDKPGELLTRYPFRKLSVEFGGDLVRAHAPSFQTPPELSVSVEKFDDGVKSYRFLEKSEKLPRVDSPTGWTYHRPPMLIPDIGSYRYAYLLEGTTDDGPFRLESPWYGFRVEYCWPCVGAGIAVLLVLLLWHSSATAKVRGTIAVKAPATSIQIRPIRRFDSDATPIKKLDAGRFTLVPKRCLYYLRRRIKFTMVAGEGKLAGQSLTKGKPMLLKPAKHTLTLKGSRTAIEVEMTLRV